MVKAAVRRNRRLLVTCAVMVTAFVGGYAVTSLLAPNEFAGFAIPKNPAPVKVATSKATTVDLGSGAHLIVPPGAMDEGTIVKASYQNIPEGGWDDLKPEAVPVELTTVPAHAIHGLLTLEFPLKNSADADTHTISTYDTDAKRWVAVATTYDKARNMIVAQIPHFSWYNPASWDWSNIGARIGQRMGQIVGKRKDAPKCSSAQAKPDWVADVTGVSTDPAIAVRACTQSQGDVLDVELVNNRPYGMYLTYGSSVKWGWHERGSSAADIARNAFGDLLAKANELYLPPLSNASVGILKTDHYAPFVIDYSKRAFIVDVMSLTLEEAITDIPANGQCLGALYKQEFDGIGYSQLAKNVDQIFNCVAQDANARAAMTGWRSERLKSFARNLKKKYYAALIGDVALDLSDLFVDKVVVAKNSLGAGFSIRGKRVENTPLSSPPVSKTPSGAVKTTQPVTPTVSPSTPVEPKTEPPVAITNLYTEQSGTHGSPTFMNYHNASKQGPTVPAMSYVQVVCRVYDGTIVSANPDGWWYKIASSPWNSEYYAVANTFWNGDIFGQKPYTHNTDFNVPVCT